MTRSRRRGAVLWGGVVALAAAVTGGALWIRSARPQAAVDPLRSLAASASRVGWRAFAPRLSGPFVYAPLRSAVRSTSISDPKSLRLRAQAMEVAGETRSPHVGGVARLLAGDVDEAVAALQTAARSRRDADPWSDLSAALILQSDTTSTLLPVIDSLGASAKALAANPNHAPALFNRALALERLGLLFEAQEAWRQYPSSEDSGWRKEAMAAASRLDRALRDAGKWPREKLEQAAANGDDATVRHIVSEYPNEARRWGESVYPAAWAEALLRQDHATAATQLDIATKIGDALLATRGERLLHDAMRGIQESDGAGTTTLARAYVRYRDGRKAHAMDQSQLANELLTDAARLFASARSPMADVTRYYIGSVMYGARRVPEAQALLDALATKRLVDRGYRALDAQIGWERGLCHLVRGSFNTAEQIFAASEAQFVSLGETAMAATLRLFTAELIEFGGDTEQACRIRADALPILARTGDRGRVVQSLSACAMALLAGRHWERAIALLDISVATSRQLADPTRISVSLAERAVARVASADRDGAAADLAELPRWSGRIHAHVRDAFTSDELYAKALLAQDPRIAITHLTAALELYARTGHSLFASRLHLERARAWRRYGDTAAARRDYTAGLELVERNRTRIMDPHLRALTIAAASELFEESIALALDSGADGDAFALAERSRGRTLLELFSESRRETLRDPIPLAEMQRSLAPNAAIIEYSATANGMVAFVVTAAEFRVERLPLNREAASRLASETAVTVRENRGVAALGEAWSRLVEPLLPMLNGIDHIAFVPDTTLARVPFAALHEDTSKRFFVEQRSVVVAPSATLAIACSRTAARPSSGKVLAIGGNAFDQRRYPGAESLPTAAAEARAVASIYPGATLLTDHDATGDRITAEMERASIIHFGGHALARPRHPLDSALLVAPAGGVTELTAGQLTQLRLSGCRLVTLSACRSGAAAMIGDGIENIAAAFLVAGVPSVVAASWDIKDQDAAEFATQFHQEFDICEDSAIAFRNTIRRHLARHPNASLEWALMTPYGGSPALIRQEN